MNIEIELSRYGFMFDGGNFTYIYFSWGSIITVALSALAITIYKRKKNK